MEIDITKVNEFTLRIENKIYKVKLVDTLKGGEFVFEILEGILNKSALNVKGEVKFNFEGKQYSFEGHVYYLNPKKVVISKTTSIVTNERTEARTEVSVLPCTIIEKRHAFLLENEKVIKGNILDLSRKGAKIEVKEPLKDSKKYVLETKLGRKEFSAVFQIRSSKMKEKNYIYGILFEEMSQASEKAINRYIDELEGKEMGKEIESIDLSQLWNKYKKEEGK